MGTNKHDFKLVVKDGDNELLTSKSASEIFFYYNMREFNGLGHEEAVEASYLAQTIYLKDQDATPLGHLSDYVGAHYKRLAKMDNVWAMLSDFYSNYSSQYYEDFEDEEDEEEEE